MEHSPSCDHLVRIMGLRICLFTKLRPFGSQNSLEKLRIHQVELIRLVKQASGVPYSLSCAHMVRKIALGNGLFTKLRPFGSHNGL